MAFTVLMYHEPDEILAEVFRENKITVKMAEDSTEKGYCEALSGCDAVVLFEQPENGFNRAIMDCADQLKLIARCGVGYETVDVKSATEKGIYVTNTPGINDISVSEAVMMMMVGASRNTQRTSIEFRKKKKNYPFFNSDTQIRGTELAGHTLGLIGCGKIGDALARMATYGMRMNVIGYDPYLKRFPAYIQKEERREDVFKKADYVSLHLPSNAQTHQSVGLPEFRLMKKDAYFINSARGNIVREKELIEALKTNVIKGAAIDVFEQEPIAESSYELFDLDRVFLLPHCASFTVEANINCMKSVAQSINEVVKGQIPTYKVNNPLEPRIFANK